MELNNTSPTRESFRCRSSVAVTSQPRVGVFLCTRDGRGVQMRDRMMTSRAVVVAFCAAIIVAASTRDPILAVATLVGTVVGMVWVRGLICKD